MLSLIITTKDPAETFKKSFEAAVLSLKFAADHEKDLLCEIILITPCNYSFIQSTEAGLPVYYYHDEGKGKPAAINEAFQKAGGEYLVFTDGDVLLAESAVSSLYLYVKKNSLAIAGGKPVTLNSRDTMMGYWSHVLVEGNAARIRKKVESTRVQGKSTFFPVSGYLYLIEKKTMQEIDHALLADDAVISYNAYVSGHEIGYCEDALVYVKYPDTYHDYLVQKVRSTGGYTQKALKKSRIRSFGYEAIYGGIATMVYARSIREFVWSLLLLLSRIHIWLLILYTIKIRHNINIWEEVSTSKRL